jgi:hypothetical protein
VAIEISPAGIYFHTCNTFQRISTWPVLLPKIIKLTSHQCYDASCNMPTPCEMFLRRTRYVTVIQFVCGFKYKI